MIIEKYCEICGCKLTAIRKRFCDSCRKQKKRDYAKQHYKDLLESGKRKLRYGITNCVFCGKEIIKNRPNQNTCFSCYKKNKHKTVDNYNKDVKRALRGRATVGRKTILDLGLDIKGLVVHHIDENPSNNKLSNLMILNLSNHASLHRILEKNWSLLLKDNSSNLENCWDTLRDQLTTAYLETKSANVIKITDIGQSAAKPLNEENIYIFDLHEEGSETMCQAPKSEDNSHGEDIVQTQTT